MAQPPKRVFDGDAQFRRGMNSVNPLDLPEGFYARSLNMLNRGGALQTRPGFRWVATLPKGTLQGFTVFTPRGGTPQLIAVVGGLVYRSLLPFSEFTRLGDDLNLSDTAPRVYFAQCVKSVSRNDDDSLAFITPVNTLIIQDTQSAPVYYDGSSFGRLLGVKTTPIGGPMVWTGDRLWVANGNKIYASDIADPYSFEEEVYNTLGGTQYFSTEREVIGMAETPGLDSPQLLVFTATSTIAFQSNIRDRSLWPDQPNFQTTILTNLGCVSHRSIVAQHGLLHWFSAYGIVSFDSALLSRQSSALDFSDNEMAFSKSHLNSDLSGVAGASFENYLLMSVPYADFYNPHTWVLDFTVRDTLTAVQPKAWSSVWTGIRPVEWATGAVQGVSRIFCASRDLDGANRVWEAFGPDRRDEFCDIDWAFESRAYTAQNALQKEFRYAEFTVSDLLGDVDLKVSWAGATKGQYQQILNARIIASEGNLAAPDDVPDTIFALKSQSRRFRTQDVRDLPVNPLTTCGIESERSDNRDLGFQLCVRGNGPIAFRVVRVALDQLPEDNDAQCLQSETEAKFVRTDGAASVDMAELQSALEEEYSASATAEGTYGDTTVTGAATAVSRISQLAADKLAQQRADALVTVRLAAFATPFVGGGLTPEDFTGGLDFSDAGDSQYLAL